MGEVTISTLEMPPEPGSTKMPWRLSQEKKKFDADNDKVDEVSRSMNVFNETSTPILCNVEKLD
jgi:hypothetical protein